MWGNTTSKNRARPSSVTSTWLSYYARINQAWTLRTGFDCIVHLYRDVRLFTSCPTDYDVIMQDDGGSLLSGRAHP
jgi:hypothetical protein